jgi:hypothetical protein
MRNFLRKTSVRVMFTGWLALAVVFAGIFVFEELDHDCPGEHCGICLQIEIAIRVIEAFGRIGVTALLAGFASELGGASVKLPAFFFFIPATPVSLKIKFNC